MWEIYHSYQTTLVIRTKKNRLVQSVEETIAWIKREKISQGTFGEEIKT